MTKHSLHLHQPVHRPDWLTYILVFLLRIFKLFRGGFDIYKVRKRIELRESKARIKLPSGIERIEKNYAGVDCTHLVCLHRADKKVIFYLHGGGMCLRMPKMEVNYLSPFCDEIGADAILPWYRLAPEHSYQAAVDDCFQAYKYVLEMDYKPENILLSGMSAGGGYALALLSLIKQNNLAMPGCAVLMSPNGDALMVGESWYENSWRDPLFSAADILYFRDLAIPEERLSDPLLNISLMDDFSGYPPLYLTASTHEMMRDVSVMAYHKAENAGVPAQLDLYHSGLHGMHALRFTGQAKVGWSRIHEFVDKHGFH